MKICSKCGEDKDVYKEFYWSKDKNGNTWPIGQCKPCSIKTSNDKRKIRWSAHLEWSRKSRTKNKEKISERARVYRLNNLDRLRAVAKERTRKGGVYYEAQLTYNRLRRARKKSALCENSHLVTTEWWLKKQSDQGGRCFYCHEVKPLTQDHVVPLTKGGKHEPQNIVAACSYCNGSKHNSLLCDWRPEMLSLIAV